MRNYYFLLLTVLLTYCSSSSEDPPASTPPSISVNTTEFAEGDGGAFAIDIEFELSEVTSETVDFFYEVEDNEDTEDVPPLANVEPDYDSDDEETKYFVPTSIFDDDEQETNTQQNEPNIDQTHTPPPTEETVPETNGAQNIPGNTPYEDPIGPGNPHLF